MTELDSILKNKTKQWVRVVTMETDGLSSVKPWNLQKTNSKSSTDVPIVYWGTLRNTKCRYTYTE